MDSKNHSTQLPLHDNDHNCNVGIKLVYPSAHCYQQCHYSTLKLHKQHMLLLWKTIEIIWGSHRINQRKGVKSLENKWDWTVWFLCNNERGSWGTVGTSRSSKRGPQLEGVGSLL